MSRQLLIPVEEAGQRVDKLLSAALEDMTRSAVQNLIENGCVTCGGKALSKSAKLKPGDQILVELPEVRPLEVRPQPIPLEVVYEDGDLLVVNKPKGMVVHPAPGHEEGTLVNALLAHCGDSLSGINGVARPGIVHRIDKDTSGLLIVELASTLHSCGSFVNVRQHNQCTFDLIKGMDIFGLRQREVLETAFVAGSISNNLTTEENPDFAWLPMEERIVISKLAAIFRLANALDKSHRHKLRDLKIHLEDDQVLFKAKAAENTLLERWAFAESAQYFKEVFGLSPELSIKFDMI